MIDDDSSARDLMKRFLAREGFQPVAADSGARGLQLARELHPSVITLDVMMPKMDGWAVLQELKNDPALCEIPVIMVTIVDDKNLGYTLGAAEYMTKPIDRERLSAILNRYRCPVPPCPILLIEDDDVTRGMMRTMLEREGWTVTEAANGREGIERADGLAAERDPAGSDDAGDGRLRIPGAAALTAGNGIDSGRGNNREGADCRGSRATDRLRAEDPAERRLLQGGPYEQAAGAGIGLH